MLSPDSNASLPEVHVSIITQKLSPAAWCYPIHAHAEHCEVIFVTGGSGFLSVNDRSFPIEKGMTLLIPPCVFHYLYCYANAPLEYNSLTFQPSYSDPSILARELSRPGASSAQADHTLPQIQTIYELLFQLRSNQQLGKELFRSLTLSLILLCQELFTAGSFALGEGEMPGITDSPVHQVYRYITEHFSERITLQSLSRQFGISVSHLSHLFSRTFGRSPIDHLIRCRITYSTTYLRKTDMTLEEVARRTGYSSITHYIRQFKACIGKTPTEFRRQEQSNIIQLPLLPSHLP